MGPARTLILVRHAEPAVVPEIPANLWKLSPQGRVQSRALAAWLAPHRLQRILTSEEPKAAETGRLLAAALSLPCSSAAGLHEHDRRGEPFEASRAAFEGRVAELFARPQALVYGRETASQAYRRFASALETTLQEFPRENLAVVTHGTVLALYGARRLGRDPFPLWKSLGMPAYLVFSLPGYRLVEIREQVMDGPATKNEAS